MKITGTVTQVLPVESGTSKAGKEWSKQNFVLETPGEYPKKVCIAVWNTELTPAQGEIVTAYIEIESREFKERWYTDVKAWKVESGSTQEPKKDENGDDLPF